MSDSTLPTEGSPSAPCAPHVSPVGTGNGEDVAFDQPSSLDSISIEEPSPPSAASVAQAPAPAKALTIPSGGAVICRYGVMRMLGFFSYEQERRLLPGSKVVARTERGVELAEVIAILADQPCNGCISRMRVAEFLQTSGPDYPFSSDGKVLRPANPQDLIDYRHLENSAREEAAFCRKEIRQLKLGMKLVTVEHLLGGERIIFFFSSENRVDFRELVRLLASQYRTRIEMRQVGARDEARLVGDYERCGRNCCCQGFLKDLHPVSMRMAKTQKATLDPTKISGRCGRLMCCLRYEDAGYEELRAKLPRKNTFVRTGQVVGKVIDGQILTQLVRLLLPDGTQVVVGNDEILERDVPAPPPQPMAPTGQNRSVVSRAVASTQAAIRQQEMQADSVEVEEGIEQPQIEADDEARREEPFAEAPAPGAAPPDAEGQRSEEGGGRRRRRRRRRGGQHRDGEQTTPAPGLGGGAPPQASVVGLLPQAGGAPQGGGESSRRHRRRRRRK